MSDGKPETTNGGRIEISNHIRVLYGAKISSGKEAWVGWAVWDDFEDGYCPVYRLREEAIAAAERMAREYANGER